MLHVRFLSVPVSIFSLLYLHNFAFIQKAEIITQSQSVSPHVQNPVADNESDSNLRVHQPELCEGELVS